MPTGSATIETARSRLDDARVGEILEFLAREAELNEDAAGQWISELACVAAEDGRVVGVSSAHPVSPQLIGGRRFWFYRSVLAPHSDERWDAMFNSTFEVLSGEFEETEDARIGLCVLVDDPAEIKRRPAALWPETELMFAGYLDDDRQVRVRYFWGAAIAPGLPDSPSLDETAKHEYPLEGRYRIVALADSDEVGPADVIRFWEREGALEDPGEGVERVREVTLVAVDADVELAGVSSLFLQRNEQLRMNLWHYRTYVGGPHRLSNLAAQLIFRNRDLMEGRFV